MTKEYYVIQNEDGKFFEYNNHSGGYPYFSNSVESCERFETYEEAKNFLTTSNYANRMFATEFMACIIRKVVVTITLK